MNSKEMFEELGYVEDNICESLHRYVAFNQHPEGAVEILIDLKYYTVVKAIELYDTPLEITFDEIKAINKLIEEKEG